MMLAAILTFLQATTAVLSFIYGALSLLPALTHANRKSLFAYHITLLVATIVFLTGVIVAHWNYLEDGQRIIFLGIFLLSLFMLHHSLQARTALFVWSDDWLPRYTEHIGFTVIALFEGFVIGTGLDLKASGWFTGGVAVLGMLVGDRVLHRVRGSVGEVRLDGIMRRILDVFPPKPARGFYPIHGGAIDGHANGSDAKITGHAFGQSGIEEMKGRELRMRPDGSQLVGKYVGMRHYPERSERTPVHRKKRAPSRPAQAGDRCPALGKQG